ncbi:MAG: S-layer homology domain-containing protein [Clostridiales bacterium]|nr:S-layer homology domain-containing protein [Clostridiales bacterium]
MCKRHISLLLTVTILLSVFFIPAAEASATNVTQKTTAVSGGMSHSIALKDDGTVWTWGSNQQWQLGSDEDVAEQTTPKQVADISLITSISAGYDFSVALKYDGSVYVFGPGGDAPIYQVSGLSGIVSVAAGQADGLALDKDGAVWHWVVGYTPSRISELKNVAAVAVGGRHFLALTSSGEVWTWGANWSGQLGNDSMDDSEVPKKVEGLVNIVSIAAGYSHSLAVASDGSVFAWGSNTYGQLGDGTTEASLTPIKVEKMANAVTASAGNETSVALTAKNEIYTWGYGEYGQRGDNSVTISEKTPTKIETEGTPVFISSGVYHNFYVSDNGNLYAWGRNRNSQIGTGKSSNESKPCKVLSDIACDGVYSTDIVAGASKWAVAELSGLHKMNILPPMLWDRYRDNVTRAEFAGLLVNMYESIKEKKVNYPSKTDFLDIDEHTFESEIRKAFELEIVNGVSSTRFNPEGEITRQEVTKMICAFIAVMEGLPMPNDLHNLTYYKDASKIAGWAIPFVAFAHDNDIMQGSSGNFDPLSNLTREQTLAIIYRTINKYEWVE